MITKPTKALIIIEVYKGSNPKLDSIVLEILSICGMFPEPKVLINKEKAKALEDIFKETLELSDLIIEKTSNLNSNKTKLNNIIKQEIKIIS